MDSILEVVQQRHPGPWDRLLDAGTGDSSLSWVCQTPARSWTAVTAEPARAQGLRARHPVRPQDRILVGDWSDPGLLAGERFDVVLADYLLGACERVAPHSQGLVLDRLLQAAQGGTLYIIGLEPGADHPWLQSQLRLRDAVLTLIDRRPHRELPQSWLEQELLRRGRAPLWSERFQVWYDQDYVEREIGAVENNLDQLADRGLAQVLRRRCQELRRQANPPIRGGQDYLLAI